MTDERDGVDRIVSKLTSVARAFDGSNAQTMMISDELNGVVATLSDLGMTSEITEILQTIRNNIELIAAIADYERRDRLTPEERAEVRERLQAFLSYLTDAEK